MKIAYPIASVSNLRVPGDNPSNWADEIDSSGPYRIKEYRAIYGILFERNPLYHTPARTRYISFLFTLGQPPIYSYEEELVDFLVVSGEDAARARVPGSSLRAERRSIPSMCTTLLVVDIDSPPFDDFNLRRAFALSVDREKLITELSGRVDLESTSILPPGMPGYTTDLRIAPFDTRAAREALAANRYGNRPPVITLVNGGYPSGDNRLAALLAQMWRDALDIAVRVEYVDPLNFAPAVRNHPGQLKLIPWCADYPDAQRVLETLFHTQSADNSTRYSNAEVDRLLEEAASEPNPQERANLYRQVETKLIEDVVVIPLYHPVSDALVNPRVQGYQAAPLGISQFINLWIQP
jgi:oligopeptide transport system substrate-binding protein